MKKRLLILPIILMIGLSACSPRVIPASRIIQVSFFDFSKYSQEGFMISPNQYIGEFEPCGELYIKIIPGEVLKKNVKKSNYSQNDDLIYQSTQESNFNPEDLIQENISPDELLKEAVSQAKKRGANAIVNFNCVEIYPYNSFNILYYQITGFAIKRK